MCWEMGGWMSERTCFYGKKYTMSIKNTKQIPERRKENEKSSIQAVSKNILHK